MKRFILKVTAFSSFIVLVFGGVCLLEIKSEVKAYRREIIAPAGSVVLVCNDSQTAMGLDPEVCKGLFNFSANGRTLDQTMLMLPDILQANPNVLKTVVIDISPATTVVDYGKSLSEIGFQAKYWLIHYLHYRKNVRSMRGGLKVVRDNMVGRRLRHFSRAMRGKIPFKSSLIGGYNPHDDSFLIENKKAFECSVVDKLKACTGLENLTADNQCFEILDSIISIARTSGLRVVLLTTPWHVQLRDRCGEKTLERFTAVMKDYAASRQCDYIDFLRFDPQDDRDWRDANHLTKTGAQKLATALYLELQRLDAL